MRGKGWYISAVNPLQRMLRQGRLQQRAIDSFVDHPGLTEQLLEIQGIHASSWSPPIVREALTVPSVFRAVTLIANTVGSLTLEAFRNGTKMDNPPELVSRPGVFSTPRDFWRDTAFSMAGWGEFLWWIVDRDERDRAKRLLLMPAHEVEVNWHDKLPLVRTYQWRDRDIPAADIVHGTFVRLPGALRGSGPLQLCGAALSVAVEANEWAARFFRRGGSPATVLTHPAQLSPAESQVLVEKWLEREGNEVRVVSGGITVADHQVDPEKAQLLQSRQRVASDSATMFGINAHFLNVVEHGSSLSYQNVGQAFDDLIRSCVAPGYLEPMEHGISELLDRSIVGRFNTQTFLRADVKTQSEVYATLVTAGMETERAEEIAGIGGLVDTQPVPLPAETPSLRGVSVA